MVIACRLSAERGAVVTVLGAIEVPPELPLDAQMPREEDEARRALAEARAVAELYGVGASTGRPRPLGRRGDRRLRRRPGRSSSCSVLRDGRVRTAPCRSSGARSLRCSPRRRAA
jgi:hypothetical protein